MGDVYPVVRVAAVQAASPLNDRDGATDKACTLIAEAGRDGAKLIVFPEGFIPSHPNWFHHHLATGRQAAEFNVELFKNAVEIPGPVTERLGKAAREAGSTVVMGVCERPHGSLGTLFNTQVYIGPDGIVVGKHQKLMPSSAERLVHLGGHGDTLGTFPTEFGPMSSLICGENNNPLAVFALAAGRTRIHAMSWPPYVSPTAASVRNIADLASRNFATVAGAFVVSACGVLSDANLDEMDVSQEHREWLRRPEATGGSMIVDPLGRIVAGPSGNHEGILYADCDLELCVRRNISRDFVGHYNRADVFHLTINSEAPVLHSRTGAAKLGEGWQESSRDEEEVHSSAKLS